MLTIRPRCEFVLEHEQEVKNWIKKLGYDLNKVFKINILEDNKAEIYRYKLNDDGQKYISEDGGIAKYNTEVIDVQELPDFIKYQEGYNEIRN